MRRTLLGVLTCALLVATSAGAATKPPTAMQLVKKLVKAGACDTPAAVNATGTVAQCTSRVYAIPSDLELHAFKTKAAMLKDLDQELVDTCDALGPSSVPFKPRFRLGPTWWTHPYRELDGAAVAAAIGGKVKTFACS